MIVEVEAIMHRDKRLKVFATFSGLSSLWKEQPGEAARRAAAAPGFKLRLQRWMACCHRTTQSRIIQLHDEGVESGSKHLCVAVALLSKPGWRTTAAKAADPAAVKPSDEHINHHDFDGFTTTTESRPL